MFALQKQKMYIEPLETERILPDSHKVHADFLYWVDGEIIRSDVSGDVRTLRNDLKSHFKLKAEEIRNYDIFGRKESKEHTAKF